MLPANAGSGRVRNTTVTTRRVQPPSTGADTSGRKEVSMERCPRCSASVGDGASWCGQCFASLPAEDPPGTARSASGAARIRGPRPPEPVHRPTYSRWRGSPTSFGPFGRGLQSFLALIALVIGYPLLRGFMVAAVGFDVPGSGFLAMYAVLAACAYGYLLSRIWQRTRVS
jgi:hypothetical protein